MRTGTLIIAGCILLLAGNGHGIDLEKYRARKARQQKVVLEQAKSAARSWNFSEAEDLLERAENMNYAPARVEAVRELLARERSRKAEQDRRAMLAEQRSRRSSASSSGGSSSGCSHHVCLNFDGPGSEVHAQVSLSPPSGAEIASGRGTANVCVASYGSHCTGGRYQFTYVNNASWVGQADYREFSGSFSVPSGASDCTVLIQGGFSASVSVSCN